MARGEETRRAHLLRLLERYAPADERELGHLRRMLELVQSAADLRAEWFRGLSVVGLTAGTSTPDEVIDAVARWLAAHQPEMLGGESHWRETG